MDMRRFGVTVVLWAKLMTLLMGIQYNRAIGIVLGPALNVTLGGLLPQIRSREE
jgi:hypothetical protein